MSDVALTRSLYGCCYELVVGEKQEEAYREQSVNYVYGNKLTTAHVTMIFHAELTQADLVGTMTSLLQSRSTLLSNRCSVMGTDGIAWKITPSGYEIVSIDESKTTRSANALFGTYRLSEAIGIANVSRRIRIFHPPDVKISGTVIEDMRRRHGNTVETIEFEAPDADIQRIRQMYFGRSLRVPAEPSTGGSDLRVWQIEQNARFLEVCWRREKIARLVAVPGAGKTVAIAHNANTSPHRFQLRIVVCNNTPGIVQMKRAFDYLGVPYKEIDYLISAKENRKRALNDETIDRIRIRQVVASFVRKDAVDPNHRAPTIICLMHSVAEIHNELATQIGAETPKIVHIDEAHELSNATTISTLLSDPHAMVVQYSGTFLDSDKLAPAEWRVSTPFFTYSYSQSVRDGCNVPVYVYLFGNEEEDVVDPISMSFNILVLFPYNTIVVVSCIDDARKHREGLMHYSDLAIDVYCVHSKMSIAGTKFDGACSVEDAIDCMRNTPSNRIFVGIFVQMANGNLDIPILCNYIDHRVTTPDCDDAYQRMMRTARNPSGSTEPKSCGNYFFHARHATVIASIKYHYDEGDIIGIRTLCGNNLVEIAQSTLTMRTKHALTETDVRRVRGDDAIYKDVFVYLAYEAIRHVKKTADRTALLYEIPPRMINVPYMRTIVTEPLRRVADSICDVYQATRQGKPSRLSLPDDFPWPEFATGMRGGRDASETSSLHRIKLTQEERDRLCREQHHRPLTPDEWAFIDENGKTRAGGYKIFLELYEHGVASITGKPSNYATNPSTRKVSQTKNAKKVWDEIRCPEMHKFSICVDVDAVCKTLLREQKRSGLGDGTVKWLMQKVKLFQLGLINHEKYAAEFEKAHRRLDGGVTNAV